MTCGARIRPFPNDTELVCEVDGPHTLHQSVLRDYAFPGSETTLSWQEADRRTFYGDWPGRCGEVGISGPCVLPAGHLGRHAE